MDELATNLRKVSSIMRFATEQRTLSDARIQSHFSQLYEEIVTKIAPDVIRLKKKNKEISNFATELFLLNSAQRGDWKWNSRVISMAVKLLYTCADIDGTDILTLKQYEVTQKDLITKIDDQDLAPLMDFFVRNLNIGTCRVPRLMFEITPSGALTFEMKFNVIKQILKKVVLTFELAMKTGVVIAVDLEFGKLAIVYTVLFNLDDTILEYAYKIFMFTAAYILPKFDMDMMFNIVDHALMNRTGLSVVRVLDLLLEPNFSRRIAANWINLPERQVKIWEKAIIYIYTINERILGSIHDALEDPYKEIFLRTADELSGTIELLRRAMKLFDGKSYENEVELLFAIYEQNIIELPREVYVNIVDRLVDSRDFYPRVPGPLQLFAVVLSGLVLTQQLETEKASTDFYFYNILNYTSLQEISVQWEERFDVIMSEQVPRIAEIISESSFEMSSVNLAKCVKVFLKYGPDQVVEVIVSTIKASPTPEFMLDAIADHEELHQLALVECLLKGVHFDSSKINCSFTIYLLIENFRNLRH
jgi:hypothetical protein